MGIGRLKDDSKVVVKVGVWGKSGDVGVNLRP